jgi:hypothetical protein
MVIVYHLYLFLPYIDPKKVPSLIILELKQLDMKVTQNRRIEISPKVEWQEL